MNIKIENYKNIKNLDYQIEDGKINFLFGMSGCGKSSVINAFCSDTIQNSKKFGSRNSDKLSAQIDGNTISPTDTHVFDVDKMNFLLNQTDVETFREVILVNREEHDKIHKELEDKILNLDNVIKKELPIYEKYESFLESLKIKKLTKNKTLPKVSPFTKVMAQIQSSNQTRLFKEIASIDSELFAWRMNGVSLSTDNLCPFCERKMSKKKIAKLAKMNLFDSKSIGNVKECVGNHASLLNFDLSYNIKKMKIIEKQLIKFTISKNQFEEVSHQIHEMFEEHFDYASLTKLHLTKEFKDMFPLTYTEYQKVFSNIRSFKKSIKKTKEATETFLSRKKKIINDIFEQMGIPYEFSVKYHRNGPNEYSIIHIDDPMRNDDKYHMSDGEKAIVTLILFLVSSKATNYKFYFIDDPVSSFDIYRRKIIYNLILKFLKGKTTIISSHDPVFAKFAISDTRNKYIGTISYLSNNGKNDAIIQSVKNVQIQSFNKSVLTHCKFAKNQYQKSILARLLLEEKCGHNSIAYTYLSKIMHGMPYTKIQNWLMHRNKRESEVVNDINESLHRIGATSSYLTPISSSYNSNIDISEYSIYEKSIVLREIVKKNKNSYRTEIVSEINNSVHLNDALAIGINVFEFPLISRTLLDEINKLPTTITL